MTEPWRTAPAMRGSEAKALTSALADRQFGRVGREQLVWLGIDEARIDRWLHSEYLYWIYPGVYAVGHRAPSVEGDLFAALLYAGPGAMLSHATAAWWLGLIDHRPTIIEISSPRRFKSVPGVQVHDRRPVLRIWHRGLPTTPIALTALDLAAVFDEDALRRVLAELDFRRMLDLGALHRVTGQGRPGSARLKRALRRHEPRFAQTRSRLEDDFLLLCERFAIPLPEVNVRIHGITVDALYRQEGVVVELDGGPNHGTWNQIKRDRRNELTLRRHGLLVVRYTWDQVTVEPGSVNQDLSATLRARR